MRTAQEVKDDFDRKGISIAAWARANGFGKVEVHRVINGRYRCKRGQAHRIAVLLGLKDGEIIEP